MARSKLVIRAMGDKGKLQKVKSTGKSKDATKKRIKPHLIKAPASTTSTQSSEDAPKKKRVVGGQSLKKIKKQQRSLSSATQTSRIDRICRKGSKLMMQEIDYKNKNPNKTFRFGSSSIECIQRITEELTINVLKFANLKALSEKRETLSKKDIEYVLSIQKI